MWGAGLAIRWQLLLYCDNGSAATLIALLLVSMTRSRATLVVLLASEKNEDPQPTRKLNKPMRRRQLLASVHRRPYARSFIICLLIPATSTLGSRSMWDQLETLLAVVPTVA
jgi:hypothetical protein